MIEAINQSACEKASLLPSMERKNLQTAEHLNFSMDRCAQRSVEATGATTTATGAARSTGRRCNIARKYKKKKHTHTPSWGKSSWPWLLCFALLQNRENQLKNLQHQKKQKAPKGRGEDGKGQGGLQLFDLSAASKSAKRRKMKTVCRLATWHAAGEAGGGNENAKNGKNFALAVDLCHIPPFHHPPATAKSMQTSSMTLQTQQK